MEPSRLENRTSPPRIPRREWDKHPNYPAHLLLLGSHENFRRVSKHLVEHAWSTWSSTARHPPELALRELFVRWKRAMRSHERYEEGKLYPYLARRYDTDFEALEAEHERLGELEREVLDAFVAGDGLRFAVALGNHDAALGEHLAHEEDVVIPMLLSLSPEDFAALVGESG